LTNKKAGLEHFNPAPGRVKMTIEPRKDAKTKDGKAKEPKDPPREPDPPLKLKADTEPPKNN
jgi:hypothetical protein